MFKTIKTLIAVAALSGTVGANVQAAEVTVHKGDTLWELSNVHNASIENIKKWNDLATDFIRPGEVLKIASQKHYVVKQSDTLWSIANENHVSVQALIEWNQLYTAFLYPGLQLVIYDDSVTPGNIEPVKQVETTPSASQASPSSEPSQRSDRSQSQETSNAPAVQNSVVQQDDQSNAADNTSASVPAAPASVQETAPVQVTEQVQPQTPQAPVPDQTQSDQATVQASPPTPAPQAETQGDAKEITVKATAYTASCGGCSGITKTGINLKDNPDEKVIAVDPSVIPLGTKVDVEGYGEATAADTGGAIKGNRIDVFMPNESDALQFGAKELTVKILN